MNQTTIDTVPLVGGCHVALPEDGWRANARQGTAAPSNYDTSCGKVTANGTGTPMQTTPSTTDFTNNSKATRPISHTGNGATK